MNRRRSDDSRSSLFLFIALALAFAGTVAGGGMHALFRNGQIRTEREIARVKERIECRQLEIQMIEVRRERLLDRYEIREQLEVRGSDLARVGHGVVEVVTPAAGAPAVASRF